MLSKAIAEHTQDTIRQLHGLACNGGAWHLQLLACLLPPMLSQGLPGPTPEMNQGPPTVNKTDPIKCPPSPYRWLWPESQGQLGKRALSSAGCARQKDKEFQYHQPLPGEVKMKLCSNQHAEPARGKRRFPDLRGRAGGLTPSRLGCQSCHWGRRTVWP